MMETQETILNKICFLRFCFYVCRPANVLPGSQLRMIKAKDILEQANQVFLRCGIKSVSMDDVARELKISKKTLYRFVKDKNDLVCKALAFHCSREVSVTCEIISGNSNAIDELIEISKYVSGQLKQVHPSIHYDLEKYYPDAWKIFTAHKMEHIYSCVVQNLEKGMKQGLYRTNINIPIIARIYISRIDAVFDTQIFPQDKFKMIDVYSEMLRYHIRGIASEKGIKYLVKKMKKEKLNLF
jgi:TetR/AcrR family transcriptional regulator, cholesterol catabolism regulator